MYHVCIRVFHVHMFFTSEYVITLYKIELKCRLMFFLKITKLEVSHK